MSDEILRNALYWFYSTVSQTLATGFGILGVFALYRFQSISEQLRAAAENGRFKTEAKVPRLDLYIAAAQWNKLLDFFDTSQIPLDPNRDQHEQCRIDRHDIAHKKITDLLGQRKSLMSETKRVLILTLVTVGFSLFVVAVPTIVARSPWGTYAALAIGLLLSICTLGCFGLLVWHALRGVLDQ